MTVDSCSLCDYTKVTKDMITEYNQKYQDAINKEKERRSLMLLLFRLIMALRNITSKSGSYRGPIW